MVISKIHVSDPGPSWPSCYVLKTNSRLFAAICSALFRLSYLATIRCVLSSRHCLWAINPKNYLQNSNSS